MEFFGDVYDVKRRDRLQRNLATIRKLLDLSAEALGNKIYVSKQTIWKWEKVEYDDEGDIKKPITYAQYFTLGSIIETELFRMSRRDFKRWIRVNGLYKLLMASDNKEIEDKIRLYADVIYNSPAANVENSLSLIGNGILEKSNQVIIDELESMENINLIEGENIVDDKLLSKINKRKNDYKHIMINYLIEQDLKTKYKEATEIITKISEGIKEKTLSSNFDRLMDNYQEMKKEITRYEDIIRSPHINISPYIHISVKEIMNIISIFFDIFQYHFTNEEIKKIIEKILLKREECIKNFLSKDYCFERFKKDISVYDGWNLFFLFNIESIVLQWLEINKINGKDAIDIEDYIKDMSQKIDKEEVNKAEEIIKDYVRKIKKEEIEEKDKSLESFIEKVENDYGDIKKRFYQLTGKRGDRIIQLRYDDWNDNLMEEYTFSFARNILKKYQ